MLRKILVPKWEEELKRQKNLSSERHSLYMYSSSALLSQGVVIDWTYSTWGNKLIQHSGKVGLIL
jgi:hypothetical protein